MPRINTDVLLNQGKHYHSLGHWEQARGCYQQIVEQDVAHAEAQHLLGAVLFEEKNNEQGLACLRKAVELAPNEAAYHISLGVALRKQGLIEEAMACHKIAIELDPSINEAKIYLGNAYRDLKQYAAAETFYQQAIANGNTELSTYWSLAQVQKAQNKIKEAIVNLEITYKMSPDKVIILDHLSQAYSVLSKHDKALALGKKMVAVATDNADIINNYASLLKNANQNDAAESMYRKAIALQPNNKIYLHNHALILVDLKRIAEAVEVRKKMVALDTDDELALWHLAELLSQQQQHESAAMYYEKALQLSPDNPDFNHKYAESLYKQNKRDAAEVYYKKSIALSPKTAHFYNNYGRLIAERGETQAARECFTKAAALDENCSEAYLNLAAADYYLGDLTALEKSSAYVMQHSPDNPRSHYIYSYYLFLKGDYQRAWPEYESRWDVADDTSIRLDFDVPLWEGESVADKTLLLWQEQGIGDEIMFGQCIPVLYEQCKQLIVLCNERLMPLYQRTYPKLKLYTRADDIALTGVDYHRSVGSAMALLYQDIKHFPQYDAYLNADKSLTKTLREKYKKSGSRRLVGFSWHSGNDKIGHLRSLDILKCEALFKTENVQFVCLQYGDCGHVIDAINQRFDTDIIFDASINPLKDLDGFAAQVNALDLIISIDNSTVHMAGALGKPVWTLLPYAPDWRWCISGETTHWYPSMRLFRQQTLRDWDELLERLVLALGVDDD